jgi:Flp pilus assembly protein TadB
MEMQRASLKTVAVVFVGSFLLLALAKQGWAQESPKQQMNVNEIQLRAFAKVYVELEKIREAYEPRLKDANDPEEARQIQTEALSKMQGVLMKEGLTQESIRITSELGI